MGIKLAHWLPFRKPNNASQQHDYLLGLRGFLVIQSFLWVFLQVFAPSAVKDSNNTSGPEPQLILRKTLSVIFWNENLLYSFSILLSARCICIPFLTNSSRVTAASSLFRRGIRLAIPTAVALAVITITFSAIGLTYVDDFKARTGNISFETPYEIPNALAFFNSVFDLFWTTHDFSQQAGNTAFPSQTLWIVNAIFQQSYTIYITMVIIPYTRNVWRVQAFACFIITAWWVQSWAWYSITGLLLADAVTNMDFKGRSMIRTAILPSLRHLSWLPYALLMSIGLMMQYLWADWRPQDENNELLAHTSLYTSGGLNVAFDLRQPQARDDNYLFILGFFLLLESSDIMQAIFKNPVFRYLGSRSFSWFLVQGIVIYTAGIKLFMHLVVGNGASNIAAIAVCFFTCLLTIIPCAEFFYRVVDYPSQAVAHVIFDWIRT